VLETSLQELKSKGDKIATDPVFYVETLLMLYDQFETLVKDVRSRCSSLPYSPHIIIRSNRTTDSVWCWCACVRI
jgi:hypothetical protein